MVNVNTGGQAINAAVSQINFDNQKLDIVSVGYSQSIFNLWTDEPSYSNAAGTVRFSGGLPSPGFTGVSGAIVRMTFRSKAAGQAAIAFTSGSVLANDGKGTNILDNLKGAFFTIIAAVESAKPPAAPSPTPSALQAAGQPVSIPIITDWPKELEEGSALTVKGLGYPNGKLLIFVQKGSADPVIEEMFAGSDGRFSYNFAKAVSAGLYLVWAKNVSNEGIVSGSSDIVTVEVVQPLFFRVGTIALNYASIIITLLALILLLILIILWIWRRIRKWQERQGVEISEAEKALHEGFEKLQSGLRKYVRYLTAAKSVEGVKRREADAEDDLAEELSGIESKIEKEIEDVEKVNKRRRHEHYGHDKED